jgi:protein TonB
VLPEAPIPAISPNNLASPVFSNAATNRPSATDRKAAARDAGPAKDAVLTPAPETATAAVAPSPARPLFELAPIGDRTPEPASPPPSPPQSAPTAAPTAAPVLVASAAKPMVAAAPSVASALQPIVKEAPEFPKEAVTDGVMRGTVKARVTVDANGKVAGIEIIDAQPRRVFDRAVRAALWRWQFEPGAPNRTAEVEIAFAQP